MPTIMFWNYKNPTAGQEAIPAALALHHDVDVLILAETTTDPETVRKLLSAKGKSYTIPPEIREQVQPLRKKGKLQPVQFQVFTRLPKDQLRLFRESGRTSIWKLKCPDSLEILLGFIHFLSKSNDKYRGWDSSEGQHSDSRDEYLTIHQAEDSVEHMRTILVGDFNMNPLEKGMIDTHCFGAMMSRELAKKHSSSKMLGVGTRRFYNPTWSRMGRGLPDAPGTYYWRKPSNHLNICWHSLDQLLLRPAILDGFRDEDFTILTSMPGDTGEMIDLLRPKTKHWKIEFSDHLPILFKLDLPKEKTNG